MVENQTFGTGGVWVGHRGDREEDIPAFFARVARCGVEPRLNGVTGGIRFEVTEGRDYRQRDGEDIEYWLVTFDDGRIDARAGQHPADTVVQVGRPILLDMINGRMTLVEAWTGQRLVVYGTPAKFLQFWLIPNLVAGAPDADHPREFVRRHRR
ncbi:SCP2 sterol-binding domain-containing protein [Plantactinospora sonchi]|uniref:SCP2 sterol-binding domain-containing protein n=1 Tax=Plantactinospora sonchi TaxID=1544735 RepID=A0ABU7RS86_9ACTN